MSIKYSPKVNLRNRCWLATDATGRERERGRNGKSFQFSTFSQSQCSRPPFPSVPVPERAPHSSNVDPPGRPSGTLLQLPQSHCGALCVPDCLSSFSVSVLTAQRAHTATLFIEFRPRRQRIIFSEKIPLVISRGKLANSLPVMPRT